MQTMSQKRLQASFATSLLQKSNAALLVSTCSSTLPPLLLLLLLPRCARAPPLRTNARGRLSPQQPPLSPAAAAATTAVLHPHPRNATHAGARPENQLGSYHELENSFGAIFMAYFQFTVTANCTSYSAKARSVRLGEERMGIDASPDSEYMYYFNQYRTNDRNVEFIEKFKHLNVNFN